MKRSLIVLLIFTMIMVSGCGPICKPSVRDYKREMRDFVQAISTYAKAIKPNFIVIPQNGLELITETGSPDGTPATDYLDAVDGVGVEELFYGYDNQDDVPTPEPIRNHMMGFLDIAEDNGLKILVTDYCRSRSHVDDSYSQNTSRGYISFAADSRELDDIPPYPETPYNANPSDITSLEEAKNFLYLINPESFDTKEEFLDAIRNTDYDIVIVDLFFNDGKALTPSDVASLKHKANGGTRLVIAYMSIGEAEDYRYYWKEEWTINPPPWLVAENPDWPGDYTVRYWDEDWQKIIYGNDDSYLKKILDAGFDGVYLDKVDAFEYFEEEGE